MYGYNSGTVFKILIPLGDECDLERILEGLGFNFKVNFGGGFKRILVINRAEVREENVTFLSKLMEGYGFDKVSMRTVSEFWDIVRE